MASLFSLSLGAQPTKKRVNVNEYKSSFSFVQQISSCRNFVNSPKTKTKTNNNNTDNLERLLHQKSLYYGLMFYKAIKLANKSLRDELYIHANHECLATHQR